MQDKKLIDIACIKDITGVYCYSLDNKKFKDTKYLGIDIVYDDDKTFSMNSNDEYFYEYLTRIKKLYDVNPKEFAFLNDFSKQVIENYSLEKDNKKITDHNFYPMNTNNFYIQLSSNYVKQALEIVLKLFYLDKEVKVEDFKGFNARYMAYYLVDNKKYNLPFSCFIDDKTNLRLGINGINTHGIRFDGKLDIKDNYVRINWNSKNKELACKSVWDIDLGYKEDTIRINNDIVYINQQDCLITNDELDDINHYLRSINLKIFSKGIKTNKNSYKFYETEIIDNDQNNISCHIIKNNDVMSIIYQHIKGYLTDDQLFTPYNYSKYLINMIKLEDNRYLIQRQNLHNQKYYYQILQDNTLYDVSVEDINSINDLKRGKVK